MSIDKLKFKVGVLNEDMIPPKNPEITTSLFSEQEDEVKSLQQSGIQGGIRYNAEYFKNQLEKQNEIKYGKKKQK